MVRRKFDRDEKEQSIVKIDKITKRNSGRPLKESAPEIELVFEEEDQEIKSSVIEEILFKLPLVSDPLIGTPKQVQKKLDKIAIHIRRNPERHIDNQFMFDKIHLYMHGFLINVALKQFPYIRGLQTVDIYQEALIALRFKAIPGFRTGKGMSFLNR